MKNYLILMIDFGASKTILNAKWLKNNGIKDIISIISLIYNIIL